MTEKVDILIVGAGLSGIGAASRLRRECPEASFLILEGRDAIGGTWDLFRYPGIRSDSDMYTLGYDFKPWRGGKLLADGPAIRDYVRETASENDLDSHIRFGQRVVAADWDSDEAGWTVTTDGARGTRNYRCGLLYLCAGYYSYKEGYTPEFPGIEDFGGQVVHPQYWPEELDYSDKTVVIIGSGATAVTLVPAMAETAARVTMLQRSPTYMMSQPQYDGLGSLLEKLLPGQTAYALTRWKNAARQRLVYRLTRLWPGLMKRLFVGHARKQLGPDYDVETHFTPRYNPWDERLCAVPENDFYQAVKSGRAEVVTDRIDCFTPTGLRLKSGCELTADIVVTATGLQLVVNGEVAFSRDGQALDFSDSWSYKGMMFSDVPNLVSTFGYINSSWTLRADLIAGFVCRLVDRMHTSGMRQVTPRLRPQDRDMPVRPWIDHFSAGYMQRVMHLFPKQGDRDPWINCQNYTREKKLIGRASLDDGVLEFSNPRAAEAA